MASNLRRKLPPSTSLQIYDISLEKCQSFAQEFGYLGEVKVASSAKDLVSYCQTVFSSLPDGNIARKVYLDGENGIITASKDSKRLFLDASTFEPETSEDIGQALLKAKVGTYVDTPLAGGAFGAREGTLSFMVGYLEPNTDDDFGTRITDALSFVGTPEKIQFCGKLGMGSACKIAHNYVALCYNLAATEGMALGLRYGIDKHILWKVMTNGCANSYQMHLEQPVPGLVDDAPSSHGFQKAFAAALTLKDLRIAISSGRRLGLDLTAGVAAVRAFEKVDSDIRTKVR